MVFLYNLTMPEILLRILAVLIYAGLQGGLLAAILTALGDRRPRDEDRLSFNPFRHVLLSGIFLGIAFRMSWIEPMPVGPAHSWGQRLRPAVAVLLSFAVLLALVPVLDLTRAPLHQVLPRTAGYMTLASIDTLQNVLVGSVALGLLPLPGLMMGTAVPPIFPRLAKKYRKLAGIGMAVAAILVILGWFPDVTPWVKELRLV